MRRPLTPAPNHRPDPSDRWGLCLALQSPLQWGYTMTDGGRGVPWPSQGRHLYISWLLKAAL